MAKLRLKLWHKFELLAALPMVVCAVVLLLLGFTYSYSDHQLAEAQRAREALDTCEFLMRTITQTTAKLWTASNYEAVSEQQILDNTRIKVREKIDLLKELCKDFPEQERTALELEESIQSSLKLMQRSIEMKAEHGIAPALKIMSFQISTQEQADNLFVINRRLTDQLTQSLKNSGDTSTAQTMGPLILIAMTIIVALGSTTAFILYKNVVTRLSRLAANSKRLAKLDKLVPPSRGKDEDEIADLEEIFYTMAESLSEAIERELASIEKAADVICTIDSNGIIKSVNSAARSAWGYEPTELLNRNLIDYIHETDQRRTTKFLAELKSTEEMETFENRVNTRSGKLIDVLWSFRKAPSRDDIFCIAHDITARKAIQDNLRKSEDRFAAIKEKMPAGILIFNEKGQILDCNPSAVTLLGRDESVLRSTRLGEIIPVLASEKSSLAVKNHLSETEIAQTDGTSRTADVIVESFDTSPDREKQFLSVMIDTTDRHKLERLKETLVAMIAHDIATPMTTIHSQLHLAQLGAMGELSSEGTQLVQSAEEQSVELMNVLTTIMKTAKYKYSTISKALTKTSLADIVDAVVDSTEAEQQQTNVEVHVQIDRSLQLLVEPDSASHAFKVVLGHLLRTCPEGQILTIESFFDEDEQGETVSIRVSHPRPPVVEAPKGLSWEFACAIIQANSGHLKFMDEKRFIACEFEFKIA